jgi:hypothetical protein
VSVSAPEPVPEPAPVPAVPGGVMTHIEEWVSRHLAPDIADIRIKAENALGAAGKMAPVLKEMASIVQEAVKALDPADAPAAASLIARAEAVAAEAAMIGAELAGI